jgi:mannose-6-phosphate isomerase-like protein (cupin superfamily)
MAEQEREKERLKQEEISPKLYYDYEGRFIKQKLERERMELLPRVVKPELFAKGGHALGDLRVFERFTVGPLSALTCSTLEVKPGERTELKRMIPSEIFYILEGSGVSIQEGKKYEFSADDVVVIPPYTTHQFESDKKTGFRAWVPQVRLWHVTGLLWQEQFEFQSVPDGTEQIRDDRGQLIGFRVPQGVLGLERDLEVRAGADAKREKVFQARRKVRKPPTGKTKYDWYLNLLVEENELEEKGPRVIRGADRPWEETRQGRLKFYISHWTEVAAQTMDLMVHQIEPGGCTGKHRHIFEELILVTAGNGHDVHEGTRYPWEAGDLICVPPMTAHQHHNDGKDIARLISVWSRQPAHEFLGGIEQISFASGWKP